ncbi:hypothetical protein HDV57DRAFT_246910 [Trichoderma longibrachiatum]
MSVFLTFYFSATRAGNILLAERNSPRPHQPRSAGQILGEVRRSVHTQRRRQGESDQSVASANALKLVKSCCWLTSSE